MVRPSPVTGSAGSRIKVILGDNGTDYVYFVDETDGSRDWQSRGWTTGPGGLPGPLAKQLNACSAKGRYITEVAHGPDGEWFVNGRMRDGSGGYSWWGGTHATDQIKEWSGGSARLRVSFGQAGAWILHQGKNGYWCSGNVDNDLQTRLARIHRNSGTIKRVRLLPNGGYFISDSEGTEWKGLGLHLSEEVKNGGKDEVLDVVVAGDGGWVVIRPERFSVSGGISDDLDNVLSDFYRNHKQRSQARAAEIRQYDERLQRTQRIEREERERREAEEEQRRQEERRAAEEKAREAREAAERKAVQEQRVLARRAEIDRKSAILSKRLKVGSRVIEVGKYGEQGQGFGPSEVLSLSVRDGIKMRSSSGTVMQIDDPSMLSVWPENAGPEHVSELLIFAKDKYEAAVSVYLCECDEHNVCACRQVGAFAFQLVADNPPPRVLPLLESHAPRLFDEYVCAEKIDIVRLKKLLDNLAQDAIVRQRTLTWLSEDSCRLTSHKNDLQHLQRLQRCASLELTARTLLSVLSDLEPDEQGCVVHEVAYRHKDPSCHQRLFAVGEEIKQEGDKYPRTVTLQGMHSDLRAPLVGAFAHDIDCANSEFRLLCSLATQLGLQRLVPTFFKYVEGRDEYLEKIARLHNVSLDDAKRLPNIVISGGQCESPRFEPGSQS